jgi:hypothetical protein
VSSQSAEHNTIQDGLFPHRNSKRLNVVSTMGQKQTLNRADGMPALPPKADIHWRERDVRFVPQADITQCSNRSHLLGHALLNFRQ